MISETRQIGGDVRRFAVNRRVTFRSDAAGMVALVETLGVEGTAPDRTARMFEATMRASLGRRIEIILDPTGRPTDVRDHAAHWAAQVDGIEQALRSKAADPVKTATLAQMLAPLRAAPASAQVQRLAGAVTAIIDPGLLAGGARSARTITLPARAHDGTTASLSGTETVARESDGTLRLERRAAGTLPTGASIEVTLIRRVSASGLILRSLETTVTRQGAAEQTTARETRITSPV